MSCECDPMRHMVVAVEATNESESAAALQGPTRGVEHLSMVCVGMVASASFLDLCDPPSRVPALRAKVVVCAECGGDDRGCVARD